MVLTSIFIFYKSKISFQFKGPILISLFGAETGPLVASSSLAVTVATLAAFDFVWIGFILMFLETFQLFQKLKKY